MKPLKFIHAADLHLDSPFVGLKYLPKKIFDRLRESTFSAFSKLVDTSISEKVDFVLLVGDLYDGEERSLKAQLKLINEFQRLKDEEIPVYIVHGNHDHMGGQWIDLQWPSNVHIFSSENVEVKTFMKNGERVANIYGYSYPDRAVYENITASFKKESTARYHIGMLHGSVEGNKEHDTYCPFTLSELLKKEFDYWALGHIHKRQNLHEQEPMIVYPGNTQGRHRKETGRKGFYVSELNGNRTNLNFVECSDVVWEELHINIEEYSEFSTFLQDCESKIKTIRKKTQGTLLTIYLNGVGDLASHFQREATIIDCLELLNESEEYNENFVWTVSVRNHSRSKLSEQEVSTPFFQDLKNTVEVFDDFTHVLEPLAKHSLYRKYIPAFSDEEKQEMLKEAEALLYSELLYQQKK